MKLTTATLLLSAVVLAGPALAQTNTPAGSAQNNDAVKPNSPFKAQGMPDAGQFNPGSGQAAPAPAPAAAPAPAPAAAPMAAPAPAPAPAPAKRVRRAPRADRG